MNPWAGCALSPKERWHTWWAWYPVTIRKDGFRVVTFFEPVLRRFTETGWEYDLVD